MVDIDQAASRHGFPIGRMISREYLWHVNWRSDNQVLA